MIGTALNSVAQGESIIVLEGHYQGKNIYVQNPFAGSGIGFCTIKVTVNEDVTSDEINSSAYEVDLTQHNLKMGDALTIKIYHKLDCGPKVLNPEVLRPKSTFETISINVGSDRVLTWKTKGEQGKLTYIVEQYRWNKWIKVGEVDGVGTAEENSYKFEVTAHSGENKFRVKQVDYTGQPRMSPTAKFADPSAAEVTFTPLKVKDVLEFSAPTMFEIFDSYGNIVKKGFGQKVDCVNLRPGFYYLNYDNKNDKFTKK